MKSPALLRGFSSSARLYLRPVGLLPSSGAPAEAMMIAGGPLAFTALEVAIRQDSDIQRMTAPVAEALAWARDEGRAEDVARLVDNITARRQNIAGLDLSKPQVMAILNITPDSFHDGGQDGDAAAAIARGEVLLGAGADIIDVGGESTRPGAEPVDEGEELGRVLPVIQGLAGKVVVSIDSRRAGVMSQALGAGAGLANDVHALNGEGCLEVVARAGVPVILMHGPADPAVMQSDTDYRDVVLETWDWLEDRIRACEAAGIQRSQILIDPGIGFSKTAQQSARIIGNISIFHSLGCAIVLGASRKSFIAGMSRGEASEDRLAGSLTAATYALSQGVQVLRVHDVAETVQAIAIWRSTLC